MSKSGTVLPFNERPIWVLAPLILALLPFAEPLRNGAPPGAGADVVNTLWTMWWFQHEWHSGAWGAAPSDLFNFPFGGTGAIISPLTATFWSLSETVVGPSWASLLTSIGLLYSCLFGLGFLIRSLGGSRLAIGASMAAFLCQRHFLFTLGDIGVVGVAVLPLILGLGCALRLQQERRSFWMIALIAMMSLQALENPYLAPALPLAVAIMLFFSNARRQLFISLVVGVCLIAVLGMVHHAASAAEYESLRPEEWVSILGQRFPVVERPWARLNVVGLFWPDKVIWAQGGMDSIHLQGRDYLGLSVIFVCFVGCFRGFRSIPWVLFAVLGLLLASGSKWGDTASLFGVLNSVADRIARSLTQPTRYLTLAGIGLSVAVGLTVISMSARYKWAGPTIWFFVLIDALCLGGLSLRLPSVSLPNEDCLGALSSEDGGVLLWPWDGVDDDNPDATIATRLGQIVHEKPAPSIGAGSWPLVGTVFPGHALRELGWRKALEGKGNLDAQTLSDWGYRFGVIDLSASRTTVQMGRDRAFYQGTLWKTCPDFEIYRLPAPRPSSGDPIHPNVHFKPILEP